MTRNEAEGVMAAWGKHPEFVHPMLWTVFFLGSIPQCFLPYPKQVLEDALNYMGRFHFDLGDRETSDFIKRTIGPLALYCDEEESIEHLFKLIDMPGLDVKQIMIDKLREYRDKRLPGSNAADRD